MIDKIQSQVEIINLTEIGFESEMNLVSLDSVNQ